MLLTRCPACDTTFRLTREQLQARGGKVRCGACRHVFNAQAYLQDDAPVLEPQVAGGNLSQADTPEPAAAPLPALETVEFESASAAQSHPKFPEHSFSEDDQAQELAPQEYVTDNPEPSSLSLESAPEAEVEAPPLQPLVLEASEPEHCDPIYTALALQEASSPTSPEDIKQQGLDAGLLSPRDLTEIPGFSRWSASPLHGLAPQPAPRALWPFVLVSLLLLLSLSLQAAYHFRGELSRNLPTTASMFAALNIPVPLPRDTGRVSIEASDLQSATEPGHLLLLATLRNQASHPQAWPALELTLTDTYDAVLIRRVFHPSDYLTAEAPTAFPVGDTPVRLPLDADNLRPAGYRLYLFYP